MAAVCRDASPTLQRRLGSRYSTANSARYASDSAAVAPNDRRHPTRSSSRPSSGTPMALANLAALSKRAVASDRSDGGNHALTAFAFAGKVGASPTPSSSRAAKNSSTPGATTAASDARAHTPTDASVMRRTPNLSSSTPVGNWQSAYVHE